MDEILLNPGYHDVSKRILTNLSDHSLVILSQTIKGISKLCEPILNKRGQKKLKQIELPVFFGGCGSISRSFTRFVKRKQILHEGHFKFPFCKTKDKNEMRIELEEFLEMLVDIKDRIEMQGPFACIQIKNLLQECVQFLPGHCQSHSKRQVLNLLGYAMYIKNLDMAKNLLRSIKDYDSCIGSMIASINGFTPYPFVTTNAMLQILKEIASECKNPNMPDMLGTTPMYHAVKSGEVKIVKVLLDVGNNLNAVNESGQNALQIAEENGHKEIVKLLIMYLQKPTWI